MNRCSPFRVAAAALVLGGAAAWPAGCAEPYESTMLTLSPEAMQRRQLQTRRFDTADELRLLVAGAGVLQDLGFNIETSQTGVGLICASKDRDAKNPAQIAAAITIALLSGMVTDFDSDQRIRVSLVTMPHGSYTTVRVTFQRVVRNTSGQVVRAEFVSEPAIYQAFFEKLSKAVFLEANEL